MGRVNRWKRPLRKSVLVPSQQQQDLPQENLDNILHTDHGKAWFELFCVAQVMEDDSFNLEDRRAEEHRSS